MGKSVAQSDIYALAVVCYEMLTGRQPFEPDNPFQLYELQKAGKVRPPSGLCKGIPKAASLAILRGLSFPSGGRQRARIRDGALRGIPAPAAGTKVPTPGRRRATAHGDRGRLAALGSRLGN